MVQKRPVSLSSVVGFHRSSALIGRRLSSVVTPLLICGCWGCSTATSPDEGALAVVASDDPATSAAYQQALVSDVVPVEPEVLGLAPYKMVNLRATYP